MKRGSVVRWSGSFTPSRTTLTGMSASVVRPPRGQGMFRTALDASPTSSRARSREPGARSRSSRPLRSFTRTVILTDGQGAPRRPALQGFLLAALILPLSVGVVVKAFAWTILLRSDGLLNRLLLLAGLADAPVRLLFTETGLVLGAVHVFLPFMVLPIFSVVKLIDPSLVDAAATLGAGPLYRFRRVTLPLTMPGVIAGVAFVFSMSVSMYVIPTLLMGDRFKTLSVLIARSFLFMRDRPLGSTVAVVLLLVAVAVVVASAWLSRTYQHAR